MQDFGVNSTQDTVDSVDPWTHGYGHTDMLFKPLLIIQGSPKRIFHRKLKIILLRSLYYSISENNSTIIIEKVKTHDSWQT